MDEKLLTEEEKKENAKKTAAVALAAMVAAGGAAVADTPIDYENIQMPDPVVMSIDDFDSGAAVDDEQKISKANSRDTISRVLLAPFYAIGAVLSWGVDLLAAAAATPIGSVILGWLVTAGIILGSLAACLKIAFPDVPLKEMLTKKNVLIVLGGTAVISGACWAIPQIWPDAGIWVFVFKITAGVGILLPLFITIRKKIKAVKEKLPHRKHGSEMEYLYYEGNEN